MRRDAMDRSPASVGVSGRIIAGKPWRLCGKNGGRSGRLRLRPVAAAAACGPWHGNISAHRRPAGHRSDRSEEHTSELQSLMRISYAVFCLKKKKRNTDI